MQEVRAKTDTYGPYDLLTSLVPGGEGTEFSPRFVFSGVKNATAVVVISDNVAQALSALAQPGAGVPNFSYTQVGALVSIVGISKGNSDVLKRQFVRSNWGGGMVYNFGNEKVYDHVSFRARLFFGGAPFIPTNMSFLGTGGAVLAPLVVTAQINLNIRGGH